MEKTKRVFGDNPISRPINRLRPGGAHGPEGMNTFEKLTCLKQPKRQIETSTILTTPESIVREHREVARLRTGSEKILGRRPDPVPWYRRINRQVIIECALWTLLMLIVTYFGISFLFGPLVWQAIGL